MTSTPGHSTEPARRRLLPLTPTTPHGSRSLMTCKYRCGNACDHPEPNTTGNPHIRDEIAKAVARRSVLKGAAVGSGVLALSLGTGSGVAAAAVESLARTGLAGGTLARGDFEPVAPNVRDAITVPVGYRSSVVIRWGDRVLPGPAFDVGAQTVEKARRWFGYNCDYVGVLPLEEDRALLVVNHEYTDEELMYPTGVYSDDEIRGISMAYHGMSVVEIERTRQGGWRQSRDISKARHNRRIHDQTEFVLDGPAAGDDRLKTSGDPTGTTVRGTFNNCAGGTTPWGTVLSGEENFNQYFELPPGGKLDSRYQAQYARYGITGAADRGWNQVDPRFDLAREPHEPHRHGWVVELDPYDPTSAPVKHTMLGRFKHEGANVALDSAGHAVAYMGDDERGDYMYKFVSKGTYAEDSAENSKLLSAGTLYAARFTGDGTDDGEFDGTGGWIALCTDTESFVPGMSVADVLIFTRLAADKMGVTRMDRPEDVEPNPINGKIYAALTNNSNRGSRFPADEANPITSSHVRAELGAPLTKTSGNRNGYVLEITEDGDDHSATTFTWNLMLVCGDPAAQETYFAGFDKAQVSPISCPDNVAFDSTGNLWISTDGNVLGSNDGVFRVPVAGANRGKVQQFLTVPFAAEACGPLITDGDTVLWVAAQHPGEVDGATFENQSSTWPHTDDFPRPAVVVAYAK